MRDGEQHAFHVFGDARRGPTHSRIGPFEIEVLEPMRRIRAGIDDNDSGISADFTFTARTVCVEEGRQIRNHGRRPIMDVTRFAQFGTWRATIAGPREDGPHRRNACLRHERPQLGLPWRRQSASSSPSPPGSIQAFFLWAPIHWEDRCTHFGVFEDANANRWHTDGAALPVYVSTRRHSLGAEDPDLELLAGTAASSPDHLPGTNPCGYVRIVRRPRRRTSRGHRARAAHLLPHEGHRLYAPGVGPRHVEGRARGRRGESWKVADLDPMAFENQHLQQVVRATCGDQVGIGVLEQIAFGPHARYGFS